MQLILSGYYLGVIAGIGGYGNCIGVPTVGGEVVFDKSYLGNPLVERALRWRDEA